MCAGDAGVRGCRGAAAVADTDQSAEPGECPRAAARRWDRDRGRRGRLFRLRGCRAAAYNCNRVLVAGLNPQSGVAGGRPGTWYVRRSLERAMDNPFTLIIGIIVIVAAGIAAYYLYNLAQETVTRKGKVVAKRTAVTQAAG